MLDQRFVAMVAVLQRPSPGFVIEENDGFNLLTASEHVEVFSDSAAVMAKSERGSFRFCFLQKDKSYRASPNVVFRIERKCKRGLGEVELGEANPDFLPWSPATDPSGGGIG